ncbi:MAG TPA: hypothetical protein VFV33_22930 [Gemmatimonadaceae bacterium]|nr:hypothetical protein [Gemmatimonadaceae bacterium]
MSTSQPRRPLLRLGRLLGALRDVWLMAGITLLLFLALEYGYRGVRGARQLMRGGPVARDSSLHPYAATDWWGPFTGQDGLAARRNRFDPYRGFWTMPVEAKYVHVDSLGRRVTPQPPVTGHPPRQLFMMGGSTMWGFSARDSFSIPAFTAKALHDRGITDVEVVNLAQQAFNSTQEATTLLVELAHGRIPSAVVFLDGYNDIATAWKYGSPGHTYGEESTQQQIELGTRGFWGELVGLGRHAEVVQRLQSALGMNARGPNVTGGPAQVCGPLAGYYRNIAISTEALGARWGFQTVRFMQPTHQTTRKALTPWERSLQTNKFLVPCTASIDSAMADRLGSSYVPLYGMFDADTATVFVDFAAHVTEEANRRIGERIADVVAPLLRSSGGGATPGGPALAPSGAERAATAGAGARVAGETGAARR